MADDYLFYEEDYEDISDWDEGSDQNQNDHNQQDTVTPTKNTSVAVKDSSSEEKKESTTASSSVQRNGAASHPSANSNISRHPQSTAHFVPQSIASSFIEHKYSVFTLQEMQQHIASMIDELATTLNLDAETVSLLLRRYQWKTDRLMEKYLRSAVQCIHEHALDMIDEQPLPTQQQQQQEIECPICVNDVAVCDTLSLRCGHRFCHECWADYVQSTIRNQSFNAILVSCPGHKCRTPLTDSIVRRFCRDTSQWAQYQNYVVQSFITHNESRYRFCPSPACHYIVFCNDATAAQNEEDEDSEEEVHFVGQTSNKQLKKKAAKNINLASSTFVQCRCGFDFCFTCLQEYHAPATCAQLEQWKLKCMKESDNAQWIVTNTKKCPKCLTRIERNHGCNHMVCTKCQFEFCWVCVGAWKEHGIGTGGYYRCNKYKPKASLGNKQKLQQSEDEELDKFVHYFNRYHNHEQSKQFLAESAHKVLRKIKANLHRSNQKHSAAEIDASASDYKSWIDVEFLQHAHDEIFFCRQILKYTYVYAYYLRAGAEKDLFEFLQQDLEKNCEILHELCEQNWRDMNASHIINYTNITHRFVKQLLHGIAKGLTTST